MTITLYGDRICGGGDLINMINYMVDGFTDAGRASSPFRESKFLGFFPILGQYTNWGVEIDGIRCAAVHLFKTIEGFAWGDDPRDTVENARAKPWVLMFYGTDNYSCFLRFGNRPEALKQLGKLAGIDPEDKNLKMLFYNS